MNYVSAVELKRWLLDGGEIALVDVREYGQYGESHLLFAVPIAYSMFETRLVALVPNMGVRLVLCDEGDGIAERAAGRAETLGYKDVFVLRGGAAAWADAGYTLYAGVNVPSKAFGELIEIEHGTPHVSAAELKAMIDAGENLVIVDGRPFAEFERTSIPGGLCCPNGELALRIDDIAPDPETTIVVNCAGRTRSIIGAQTLVDLDIPNRIIALENGTQGWTLAGLELQKGAAQRYSKTAWPKNIEARRQRALQLAEARGVRVVETAELADWVKDESRTTFLFDIRTEEEVSADGSSNLVHAPGGQLVQASDFWIGVRGARIVLADSECIRAPVVAAWLRQLGHEAYVLAEGVIAAELLNVARPPSSIAGAAPPAIDVTELRQMVDGETAQIIDLRSSTAYRQGHIRGAVWSIRPRITALDFKSSLPVILIAENVDIAELAAIDLREAGVEDIHRLDGGVEEWRGASLPIVATPDDPTDEECIDFLFFTHRRAVGDLEHSRQYLAWEIALVDQLSEDERAAFDLEPAPST